MTINWIHLDFKGIMPGEQRLIAWINWFADRGFNGVVFEYEDRLPWQTWPGIFRPGLSLAQWQRVIAAARDRGMEVVPLIQTHGHLEWLLKLPQWSTWRENGCFNELCPQNTDVMPAIEAWLDEIVAIHDQPRYLHIGGDETWNLATCPQCRNIAEASADEKLHVYITHLCRVAEAVIKRGMQPLIWADAFWREKRMDLVARLPSDVILCDWQYAGTGPWTTVQELAQGDRMILGSSSARCSFDLAECAGPQQLRIDNVTAWHNHTGTAGLIHTVWARTRSLLPQYGPWEGWLPGLIAAGDPQAWPTHPLAPWVERFDAAMAGPFPDATRLADELDGESFADEWADACRRWWVLALRWRVILFLSTANARTSTALEAVYRNIGVDPDFINHQRLAAGRMRDQTRDWETQVRSFFADRDLGDLGDPSDPSDVDEFIASRTGLIHTLKTSEWADTIIPVAQPRTAR